MTKNYDSSSVRVLSDIEHVRLRTAVYLGNMNEVLLDVPMFQGGSFETQKCSLVPAALRAVCEIIDNSVDEFTQAPPKKPLLQIAFNPSTNRITVSDNGRGVPIDRHETGPYTPEVVFGSLRSGRNFTSGKEAGVRGMNGVGSSVTNFTSTLFEITIQRDKQQYHQEFRDGSNIISEPKITKISTKATGTQISFILDGAVYSNPVVSESVLKSIAQGVALANPGITVKFTNQETNVEDTFLYPKGFENILSKMGISYYAFRDHKNYEFFVIPKGQSTIDEQIYTWVNSGLLFDGGLCNVQFFNAFVDSTIEACAPQAKRQKCTVTKNDVREGLLIIGNIKVSDPEFDSQAKTRLTGPNLRNEFKALVSDCWSEFARKNKDWLAEIVERAAFRFHGAKAKETEKEINKKSNKPVPGLLDAVNKNREACSVIITEGLSAAAMIEDVRDATTLGSFPLSGKFNNVWGCQPGEILAMSKLTNLLAALKLIPGKKSNRANLHFGAILIASDADPDGDSIFALTIGLLYNFWPELFDPANPYVYRLIAPNICCVKKGQQRVHFTRAADYEKVKSKFASWEVRHLKGLGGMQQEDWNMILNNPECKIPITDDGNLRDTLELIFGNNAEARREWLQTEEEVQ